MEANINSKYIFSNQAEDIYALHTKVMADVAARINLDDLLLFKIKVVLTEMLTNAIKHAGCDETVIEIVIQTNEVVIKKRDLGNSFTAIIDSVRHQWPLPGRHFANKTIYLYGDKDYSLKANTENNFKLTFLIEEHPDNLVANTIDNLQEHFGLMIIAKACDSFEYEFDIDACNNIFTATFKL